MSLSILYFSQWYLYEKKERRKKWWEKSHSVLLSSMISACKRTKRAESIIKSVTTDIKLEIKWTQLDRNRNQTERNRYTAYVHILISTNVFDFHTRANRKFVSFSPNHSISLSLCLHTIRTSLHTVANFMALQRTVDRHVNGWFFKRNAHTPFSWNENTYLWFLK